MSGDSQKLWCVKHRDGWCAINTGKPFPETKDQVFTKCRHWIIFPWGQEKREPTCLECLEVLDPARQVELIGGGR